MKENLKNYIRNLGMSEDNIEIMEELDSIMVSAPPNMMLTDEAEAYIDRGLDKIESLGDYETFQILQDEELTIFLIYRDGESEALEKGECIIYALNNQKEEFSDAGIAKVVVDEGEIVGVCI